MAQKREGILLLGHGSAGNKRHFVYFDAGDWIVPLDRGDALEVALGKRGRDGELEPAGWLAGRYELRVGVEGPAACLVVGCAYPGGQELVVTIPEGARVRLENERGPDWP